ncbi:MAG: type II secretion system major pseudopilin GspG [Verrucomicrobia bacterium]|nr:type II secretion system major pseudopilin GspG [Verrucomicrobiota bacterium]
MIIQVTHRPHSKRQSRAFTLIEIMVVVVILGILAATIIPQFMGTTHDAKVSSAKSNIAELESAMERFYIHMDRHPTAEEGLRVLVEAPAGEEERWRGPYIKLLRPDPWGNPFQYRNPGTRRASGFDLWSRGADGADGGEKEAADIGNW